jgi:hypothetical protein
VTEKFLEYIKTAETKIQKVDHMIYITFPLIKDKRLLLTILSELNIILLNILNAILQYDFIYKKIRLSKNSRENLETFIEFSSKNYNINEKEIKLILELLDLSEKHKKSPFEFIKEEKVVILSDSLNPSIITLEKAKEFLLMEKTILKKVRDTIKRQ